MIYEHIQIDDDDANNNDNTYCLNKHYPPTVHFFLTSEFDQSKIYNVKVGDNKNIIIISTTAMIKKLLLICALEV
jgi:hypothetical protein